MNECLFKKAKKWVKFKDCLNKHGLLWWWSTEKLVYQKDSVNWTYVKNSSFVSNVVFGWKIDKFISSIQSEQATNLHPAVSESHFAVKWTVNKEKLFPSLWKYFLKNTPFKLWILAAESAGCATVIIFINNHIILNHTHSFENHWTHLLKNTTVSLEC